MREFDEVIPRADGAENVFVASRQVIVDDGAELRLLVGAASIVLAEKQLLFSLKCVET